MPFWKRKIVWIPALCLTLFLGLISWGYRQAPRWIVEYAATKAPYLEFRGGVTLGYPEIVFHEVSVKKEWVRGTITRVRVDADKNVWVEGGNLELSLDKKPPSKEEGTQADGTNLRYVYLDSAKVTYRGVRAEVNHLRHNPHSLDVTMTTCADKAKVWIDEHVPSEIQMPLRAKGVCVDQYRTKVKVLKAEADVVLPRKLPRLEQQQTVSLTHVIASRRSVTVGAFQLGKDPFIRGEGVAISYKEGQQLELDMHSVTTNHPWIAPTEKTVKDVSVVLTRRGFSQFAIGNAAILFDLENPQVSGEASCSDWIRALPQPVSPALQGAADNFKGRLFFDVQVKPVAVNFKHNCEYTCKASPLKELKATTFKYEAYDKGGNLFTRETGRGTEDWTPLGNLPVNVPSAFIRLEDPSFVAHRGILRASLQVALEKNLKKKGFRIGGSTISQQLAKNLWLRRHKTLGRKIEEAFLTMALEHCLDKNEILELYLNVVEYGPDLYGIGPASEFYFEKDPQALTLDEAYYLAQLLPHPKKAIHPKKGGLLRAQQFMALLARRGLLSEHLVPLKEEELEGELDGWETF